MNKLCHKIFVDNYHKILHQISDLKPVLEYLKSTRTSNDKFMYPENSEDL